MMSEWLKIMLEEIARKQAAAEAAAQEEHLRRQDLAGGENRGAGPTTG